MGTLDPTLIRDSTVMSMARRYKSGPATTRYSVHEDSIVVEAWGPGAKEALDASYLVLGLHDNPPKDLGHPRVNRTLKSVMGVHLCRMPFVSQELMQHVLQQQISWRDAAKIWKVVIRKHGEDAPGPLNLKLPLSFEQLKKIPHHDFQVAGIIENRIPLLREIGRLGHRIDDWLAESVRSFQRKIQTIPQMGPWTANHVLGVSMGEPDVIVPGDFAMPHTVSWGLIGKPRSSDREMIQLLEPFRGNRWRIVRLLWAKNINAPRRGHRIATPHTKRS